MEKRSKRPMFIGPAINNLLRKLGAKSSDSDLAVKWDEIVKMDCKLVRLSRGNKNRTVYVRANNPSEKLLMSYQAPEIIKRINAYFGFEAVSKVVIK